MYLWFLAAVLAYFIKGLCGFANTLVFTSVLSFRVENANISPIDLLIGYPSNVILAWKYHKKLDPNIYLPLVGLVLAGSIPGVFLLKHVNATSIKVVFGIVVIVLGMQMLLKEYSSKTMQLPKFILALIGILSGVLCGLFGVGALLATYVGCVTNDTDTFKANLSAVFIVDNTVRLILYSCLHILTMNTVKMSLLLFPFALLGLWAGMKCSNLLNEKHIRILTSILLVISGVSMILKNI